MAAMNIPNASSECRSVFVGNIPYTATEKEIMEVCEEIGPVVSFNLVLDKNTGKPKGYGFCHYLDHETARSAVRNMNNYEFQKRLLRVNLVDNDDKKNKPCVKRPFASEQQQLQQSTCGLSSNNNTSCGDHDVVERQLEEGVCEQPLKKKCRFQQSDGISVNEGAGNSYIYRNGVLLNIWH